MSLHPDDTAAKRYDDGLQVHNADEGLYVHSPGLEVDNRVLKASNYPPPQAVDHIRKPAHPAEKRQIQQSEKEVLASEGQTSSAVKRWNGRSRKMLIAGILLLLVLVLGIGLGVGLGIGLKHSSSDNGTSGGPSGSTNGSSPSTSGSTGVMNGSSLAAVMTPDNSRRLFYQNSNGSIGCSVYSLGSWKASNVIGNARNNTPISAILVGSEIMLVFADTTSALKYSVFGQSQTWSDPVSIPYSILGSSTSISVTPVTCKDASSGIVLFFEDSSRIRGVYGTSNDLTNIPWTDFSSNLTGTLWNTLGSPISTANSYLDNGLTLNAFFYNRQSESDSTASILREVAFSNFSTCHISTGSNYTTTELSDALRGLNAQNDLVTLPLLQYPWFVINGKLSSVNGAGGLNPLTTPFPFTRLASINGTNSSNIYLYNQLNQTVFLEHVALGRENWTTTQINIASG